MSPIYLLVVADDPFARSGLALLVGELPACTVVDQLSASEAAAVSLETDFDQTPDALVWDVGWESADVLPDWEEMALPIVALLPDSEDVPAVWASGVSGLLPRSITAERLLAAIEAVVQGLVILDPMFLEHVAGVSAEKATDRLTSDLTPREVQVLQLLAEGVTNRAIAQRLAISDHTVKFHVNAIMSKLGAQSRTEAVVRATRLGLISL